MLLPAFHETMLAAADTAACDEIHVTFAGMITRMSSGETLETLRPKIETQVNYIRDLREAFHGVIADVFKGS
jgi:hypothetical protein